MAREETLRALITASAKSMVREMKAAAESTRDLREAMIQSIGTSGTLAGVMDTSEEQTEEYKRAVASLSRESTKAAIRQEMVKEGVFDAGRAAAVAAAQMDMYEGRVEEVGEESREATAESFGLAAALRTVGAAAGEASVNIGPFNTSVKRAAVALPALIGLVGAATVSLVGMSVAAIGAAGALTALFAGGFVGAAENLAASSADIENRMEALEEMMSRLGSAVDEATEPIQGLAEQEAVMEMLSGLVTFIGDLARSAEELAPLFGRVGDRLGETFWAEEARGIAEMEKIITDLMPLLEDLTFYILANLPDFLAWVREQTLMTGDAWGDFLTSLIPVVRELIEFGNIMFRFLLPSLSLLLDMLVPLMDLFTSLPEPLQAAAGAFAAAAAASTLYAGGVLLASAATGVLQAALAPLVGALGTLAGVLSLPVVAVAALIAIIVGLISWLDLWDDILRGLIDAWNFFVDIIEAALNVIVALVNALLPVEQIMKGIQIGIKGLQLAIRTLLDWLEPVIGFFVGLAEAIGLVLDRADRAGGISLEAAKLDDPAAATKGGPSRKGGSRPFAGAGSGVRARGQEVRQERKEYNFDFSGATFGEGMSPRTIEKMVQDALNKAESQSSDT